MCSGPAPFTTVSPCQVRAARPSTRSAATAMSSETSYASTSQYRTRRLVRGSSPLLPVRPPPSRSLPLPHARAARSDRREPCSHVCLRIRAPARVSTCQLEAVVAENVPTHVLKSVHNWGSLTPDLAARLGRPAADIITAWVCAPSSAAHSTALQRRPLAGGGGEQGRGGDRVGPRRLHPCPRPLPPSHTFLW